MLLAGALEVSIEVCPNRLDVLPAMLVLGKVQLRWDFDGSVILLWFLLFVPAREFIEIDKDPAIPSSTKIGCYFTE